MKSLISNLLSVVFTFLIAGCSDKLTSSKAERIIKEAIKFPVTEKESFEHGLVIHDWDSLPRVYYRLSEKGMFSVEYIGDRSGFPFGHEYLFRVTPSLESKKYYTEGNPKKDEQTSELKYKSWFKTCDVEFDDIKEIREIPAFNGAEITYQVKRINFTPFWEVYLDGTLPKRDTIQLKGFSALKTNDGWKAAR
ncbi:hypothetical protein [Pseudoflavitalea rhizosphaerae]|uniref:hypothetical protein n=1 Tax=Pseudoflavitalea rhizosphaerae TaxID=1884793 RepID=UPI000F8F5A59|nr:hypothetical protein [Pseudoflavitalea rhizosphaerae]